MTFSRNHLSRSTVGVVLGPVLLALSACGAGADWPDLADPTPDVWGERATLTGTPAVAALPDPPVNPVGSGSETPADVETRYATLIEALGMASTEYGALRAAIGDDDPERWLRQWLSAQLQLTRISQLGDTLDVLIGDAEALEAAELSNRLRTHENDLDQWLSAERKALAAVRVG